MSRAMKIRTILAALLLAACAQTALAAPARIIILRHGEKADKWKLCQIGQQRADALRLNYLGKGAAKSLFTEGNDPAFFFAITLHTLELASPAAASWSKPLILYSAVPEKGTDDEEAVETLNRRTQEAASNIMQNPALNGKTVVMVWEHKHIANAKLVAKSPGEAVTLRQLLQLDRLKDVPETWPSGNYDYFWVVDYAGGSGTPTGFRMVKQAFEGRYSKLPANDWGAPNGLTSDSQCDLKGAE